jgi:nicotinamide riboside kinase
MTQESNSATRSAYQRNVIVGNSGSGKSWLVVRLAQAIKGTAIDLDAIHWELGDQGAAK